MLPFPIPASLPLLCLSQLKLVSYYSSASTCMWTSHRPKDVRGKKYHSNPLLPKYSQHITIRYNTYFMYVPAGCRTVARTSEHKTTQDIRAWSSRDRVDETGMWKSLSFRPFLFLAPFFLNGDIGDGERERDPEMFGSGFCHTERISFHHGLSVCSRFSRVPCHGLMGLWLGSSGSNRSESSEKALFLFS
jgi:hypothetical protein